MDPTRGQDKRFLTRGAIGLVLALALGCGGDDDSSSVDAMAAGGNHLGELCSDSDPCPAEHDCIFLDTGNPDLGYCSPICITDEDCGDGYTGPASGMLTCFAPGHQGACTIACETGTDCPAELACLATGGPISVCTTE
jgi:hypothetical protein